MAHNTRKKHPAHVWLATTTVLTVLVLLVPRVQAAPTAQTKSVAASVSPHTATATRQTIQAAAAAPGVQDFIPAGPQGFGDRMNSWAWGMAWWQGHLYVGTNRAWQCVVTESLSFVGAAKYPPSDSDTACTQNYADLPLQAEIWRWTPPGLNQSSSAPGTWDRVYQSPNTIPNPDPALTTTKYLPPEIGFRGLVDTTKPDGTHVLIASGVSAKGLLGGAQTVGQIYHLTCCTPRMAAPGRRYPMTQGPRSATSRGAPTAGSCRSVAASTRLTAIWTVQALSMRQTGPIPPAARYRVIIVGIRLPIRPS